MHVLRAIEALIGHFGLDAELQAAHRAARPLVLKHTSRRKSRGPVSAAKLSTYLRTKDAGLKFASKGWVRILTPQGWVITRGEARRALVRELKREARIAARAAA